MGNAIICSKTADGIYLIFHQGNQGRNNNCKPVWTSLQPIAGPTDADPRRVPGATFLAALSHREAIERQLGVMDSTALSLCMDNDLPIYVFNMADARNIDRIVCGERVGTIVQSDAGGPGRREAEEATKYQQQARLRQHLQL